MKKIVKVVVIAVIFVMCFLNVACMGCNDTPVEPDASENRPSDTSEPVNDNTNQNTTVSDEETAYRAWKDVEVSEPAFGETGANISAGDLLERAVVVEDFITRYPNSTYRDEAVKHYNKLVTAAITGGYVDGENNKHLYLDENGETLSADVVTEYDTFVNNYGNTQTAAIIGEYTTLIGDADGSLTEDIKNFYNDLVNRLENLFDINGNGNNGSGMGGGANVPGNNSGNNGNTGNGNRSGQSVQ